MAWKITGVYVFSKILTQQKNQKEPTSKLPVSCPQQIVRDKLFAIFNLNFSMKISDLDSKFQKPYPQSGGVEFGVEFLLDCKPPRGVPEPTSKFKLSKTSFILDG